jgi:hypothetical protein
MENRDGNPDLIWQQDGTHVPAVWYMGGGGGSTIIGGKELRRPVPRLHIVGLK